MPPQHGKTELLLHGIAWFLWRHPTKTIGYVSYAADVAHSKSRLGRAYAEAAGIKLREDSNAVHEWRTRHGGGVLATGVGGPLTGHGIDGILVVDDPHKNREEAESQLIRDKVEGWFTSTAMTRIHPGTSVIALHTRWHDDDLIGRLSQQTTDDGRPKWEIINLPALNEHDEPLWHRRPLEFLKKQRDNSEYDWWSLYMGSPRVKGSGLFRGTYLYEPTERPQKFKIAIGVDFAYSQSKHADWSAAVVLAKAPTGECFVLDVLRGQIEAPVFRTQLAALCRQYSSRARAYLGGTEQGIVDFMTRDGVPIEGVAARGDKFQRAQPVAAAWNQGRVMLPRGAAWAGDFVREVLAFTGVRDRHDDQVDALAAAFDMLDVPAISVKPRVTERHTEENAY